MAAAKQSREPTDTFMLYIPGTDRSQIELLDTLQPPPIPLSASHRPPRRSVSLEYEALLQVTSDHRRGLTFESSVKWLCEPCSLGRPPPEQDAGTALPFREDKLSGAEANLVDWT